MKRHYWYHTDLPVFEAAVKIRETIFPIFHKNMNELRLNVAQTVRSNQSDQKESTWEDTGIGFLDETKEDLIPIKDSACFFSAIDRQVCAYHTASIKRLDSRIGFWFEVILLPHPDGGTVFKVFSTVWDYSAALWRESWCRDYSYWDNSPKYEEDSEEDWAARKKFWEDAAERNLTTSQYVSIVPPTWYEDAAGNWASLTEVCSTVGFDPLPKFTHSPGAVRDY